jgi:hypothetical protein
MHRVPVKASLRRSGSDANSQRRLLRTRPTVESGPVSVWTRALLLQRFSAAFLSAAGAESDTKPRQRGDSAVVGRRHQSARPGQEKPCGGRRPYQKRWRRAEIVTVRAGPRDFSIQSGRKAQLWVASGKRARLTSSSQRQKKLTPSHPLSSPRLYRRCLWLSPHSPPHAEGRRSDALL